MLVPVDGSLLMGVANTPSNAPFALLASWLWCYADWLLVNRAGVADGPSWLYSAEGGRCPIRRVGAAVRGCRARASST
jgi:hypothetical protein